MTRICLFVGLVARAPLIKAGDNELLTTGCTPDTWLIRFQRITRSTAVAETAERTAYTQGQLTYTDTAVLRPLNYYYLIIINMITSIKILSHVRSNMNKMVTWPRKRDIINK